MTNTNTAAAETNAWIIVRLGYYQDTRAAYWTGEEWKPGYQRAQVFESEKAAEEFRLAKGWGGCNVVPF